MNPNPNTIFPIQNCNTLISVKPTITNPNIIVGEFTLISRAMYCIIMILLAINSLSASSARLPQA